MSSNLSNAALLALTITMLLGATPAGAAKSRWGADYFPDVTLVTHEGKEVNFYRDLVQGKVVSINFIFTSCKDVCPAETARMRQVQKLLGERVGDDVHMYSISTDPEVDTPEVLAAYRKKFGVEEGWTFLTGKKDEIDLLQRKLGLLITDLEDPRDHNINLVVGNEETGRWMKRSPYDNPDVLANLLGGALHNWAVKGHRVRKDYAEVYSISSMTRGEVLFQSRCNACHTVGEGDGVGPDLFGVMERRDREWLSRWLTDPDGLIAEGDPQAIELLEKYEQLRMPNLRLEEVEVTSLLEFFERETQRVTAQRASGSDSSEHGGGHGSHHAKGHDPHAHH